MKLAQLKTWIGMAGAVLFVAAGIAIAGSIIQKSDGNVKYLNYTALQQEHVPTGYKVSLYASTDFAGWANDQEMITLTDKNQTETDKVTHKRINVYNPDTGKSRIYEEPDVISYPLVSPDAKYVLYCDTSMADAQSSNTVGYCLSLLDLSTGATNVSDIKNSSPNNVQWLSEDNLLSWDPSQKKWSIWDLYGSVLKSGELNLNDLVFSGSDIDFSGSTMKGVIYFTEVKDLPGNKMNTVIISVDINTGKQQILRTLTTYAEFKFQNGAGIIEYALKDSSEIQFVDGKAKKLWDMTVPNNVNPLISCISPNGKMAAVRCYGDTTYKNTVMLFDLENLTLIGQLECSYAMNLSWNSDGTMLAYTTQEGSGKSKDTNVISLQ